MNLHRQLMVTFNIHLELFTLSGFKVERILSGRFYLLADLLRLSRLSARSSPFSAPLTCSAMQL